MKKIIHYKKIIAAGSVLASLLISGVALAAANPNGSGQPTASCEDSIVHPNGFSSGGFAKAELRYAGTEDTPSLNSNNEKAVSQYDVACYQLSN